MKISLWIVLCCYSFQICFDLPTCPKWSTKLSYLKLTRLKKVRDREHMTFLSFLQTAFFYFLSFTSFLYFFFIPSFILLSFLLTSKSYFTFKVLCTFLSKSYVLYFPSLTLLSFFYFIFFSFSKLLPLSNFMALIRVDYFENYSQFWIKKFTCGFFKFWKCTDEV